jgi:inner membrane protein
LEPVTQGLLGGTFGQALYGRALGRKAVVYGALAGMLPDVDVVMNLQQPVGEFVWHRGPTHALWFGPLVGPALGYWLWRRHGRAPETLGAWIGLMVVAIVTHPLLDAFTSYGTQLLTPFTDTRFAWDAVAIVDPAYSLLLLLALLAGRRLGVSTPAARAAALVALSLSTGYLGWGLALESRARARVDDALRAQGITGAEIHAYPTLLQLHYRRIVVHEGGRFRIGWLTTWSDDPGRFEAFAEPLHPLIAAARATPEGRVLEWFAAGLTAGRVIDDAGGSIVEIDDVRYGLPGRPRDGFWGLRFRFGADGRPTGPVVRFNRPLPAGTASQILGIFREAYFN